MADWILITSEDLPTLPHVATRVLKVVGDPDSSAKDLEKVIETDSALTQRLLRMANSAIFVGSTSIQNLRAAITRLGFNRVKNLILIAATRDVFPEENAIAIELWRHSLGVAIGCRLVSEAVGQRPSDDIFLAGLFHDIGKVLINNQKPERYEEIIETAIDQRRPTSEVEKQVFRFTHEEVGVMIIQKWGLPDSLVNPIRHHHTIQSEECEPLEDQDKVAIVATADLIANMLNIGLLTSVSIDPVSARSSRLLGLTEERIMPILEKLPELFLAEIENF